jgi:hypothetical protein
MQRIEAKVQINADRKLTVQLPADVQTGEYDIVLVLNSRSVRTEVQESGPYEGEHKDKTMAHAWEKWVEEVERLPLSPNPTQGDYQQYLIEKYRKQGLEL